jgi:hypothetical protein
MTRATLRYLHSPDALDLDSFTPEDPGCFQMLIQAMIGPEDGPGEESFDFIVCTPRWLGGVLAKQDCEFGRHYLVVRGFEIGLIKRALADLCARAVGRDWASVAAFLSRYGKWEFEDYVG